MSFQSKTAEVENKPRKNSKKISCGINVGLLAKIRARQRDKLKRDQAYRAKANHLSALPAFCDQVHSYFLHRTGNRQAVKVLVQELVKRSAVHSTARASPTEVEAKLRELLKIVPEWCSKREFQVLGKKNVTSEGIKAQKKTEEWFIVSKEYKYSEIRPRLVQRVLAS